MSFMSYDLGFGDHETCRIEGAVNPFAPKVSSMFPVRTVIELSRLEITSLPFSGSLMRFRNTRFIYSHGRETLPMQAGRTAGSGRDRHHTLGASS